LKTIFSSFPPDSFLDSRMKILQCKAKHFSVFPNTKNFCIGFKEDTGIYNLEYSKTIIAVFL